MKSLILSVLVLFSFSTFAHEGAHGPEQTMAPHGGVLKDGKNLMAELVQDNTGVKIYFLTHTGKAITTKSITLEAKNILLTDAKKKAVSYELVSQEDSVLLKFDKSKSYRYNLTMPARYNNVQETLSWHFEPQSN